MEVTLEILKHAIEEVFNGKNIDVVIDECTEKQICMHFKSKNEAFVILAALSKVLDAEAMHLYLGDTIGLVIDLLSLDIKVAA